MQLSSSTSKTQFPLFSFCQNPNSKKIVSKLQIKSLQFYSSLHSSPCSTKESASPLQQNILLDPEDDERNEEESQEKSEIGSLVVRRPTKDLSTDLNDDSLAESDKQSSIDQGLSDFAKTMPMFEPERVEGAMDKPLAVNLELALYKAKILGRNFQFEEAEKVLQKCILFWPEDGRPYVALGKILCKQSKYAEARLVYEKGCQATQGENSYIWQCWAVLENKNGNVRRARELFDAATVADKKHIAAWHGWAILEIQQGNLKKARNLLGKGLKYSGGNEYIYQTLALLEAKGNRIEQARYLFRQATSYNPKSCASWLAWAQLEMQQENYRAATELFEKAVQASPKNRFAWHVWALFEINLGKIEKGRKLLKIGHALNPRDPVILQSLALLEYKHSSANLARVLFRRASELDPRHQPVWMAWGWLEWKEGNISTARELYQRALSINSTSDSAARCLQAWGVLEQRAGNMSAARRLFRSSLNINPQSYVTWMTWATLEEQQGNSLRAEEIKNLYFQQRTEVVDDGSWVIGFLDVIDPALESLKRLLNFDQVSVPGSQSDLRNSIKPGISDSSSYMSDINKEEKLDESSFDLDSFIKDKLSLDSTKLDAQLLSFETRGNISSKRIWKSERKTAPVSLPS